jgi:hypothetical protein
MPSQLRIYTIKPGLMRQWLEFFHEKVVPLQAKHGMSVHVGFVSEAANEFIWVRDFSDDESIEVQEERYYKSEERLRVIGDEPKRYIDAISVRGVDLAYERP